MRIALVCPYAWDRYGGVQSHVASLAAELKGRRHEVIVIAPLSVRARSDAVSPPGVDVVFTGRAVGVPANGSVAPLAFGPAVAAGVRRALEALEPDVVHVHEPLIPSVSLLAVYAARAPLIGTFHAAADSSLGYRAARGALAPAMNRIAVRTTVSAAARALIERYFPGEYLLTPNGVDTARFARAEPLDLGAGRRVLFLGRMERRKGLEVLVRAMVHLRDLDVALVAAGTGPEQRRCRRLSEQLDVTTAWLGRLAGPDVARAFRSADVYCAPGLGGESFGIVLVEAMAAGTAVVCSDLDGFRAVTEGAAELTPPGDVRALASALRTVLSDEEHARSMARAGDRIASKYDWKRLVPGVEKAYEQARAGRGA
jgi:phosphatidyl-myo-inositol alpha-mannosyltransferase